MKTLAETKHAVVSLTDPGEIVVELNGNYVSIRIAPDDDRIKITTNSMCSMSLYMDGKVMVSQLPGAPFKTKE